MASLEERLRQSKKAPGFYKWSHVEQMLIGQVKLARLVKSQLGEQEVVDILEDETNITQTVGLTAVLKRLFEENTVNVGDRIGIKYLGRVKSYHDFILLKE